MPAYVYLLIAALIIGGVLGLRLFQNYQTKAKETRFYDGLPTPGGDPMQASTWQFGPRPFGTNRSVGMPNGPVQTPDGPQMEWPVGNWDGAWDEENQTRNSGGHVHAWTYNHGPLSDVKAIRMRIRVDLPSGVQIRPHTAANGAEEVRTADFAPPAELGIAFQEKGDDWSAGGKFEPFRWYSAWKALMPVTDGEHVLEIPLVGPDAHWSATQTSTEEKNPEAFKAAIDNAQGFHITLGGGSGQSHGQYATAPGAKLTLLELTFIK